MQGMLTQAGDVWLRVTNHPGSVPFNLSVPFGVEYEPSLACVSWSSCDLANWHA